jgi:hypothetical protein
MLKHCSDSDLNNLSHQVMKFVVFVVLLNLDLEFSIPQVIALCRIIHK